MTEKRDIYDPSLPLPLVELVDEACDRFEGAWRSGEKPQIEEYVDAAAPTEQSVLFRYLLLLELDYRTQGGEAPAFDEYRARFPDQFDEVHAIFADIAVSRGMNDTADGKFSDTDESPRNAERRAVVSIGKKLDRFRVIELLGEGAFGKVYRARDPQLDRDVALKIPRMGSIVDEQDVQRFMREARAAGQLWHPHIVPVYDAGKIGSVYYIASAFVDGRTLRAEMKRPQRFSHREAAELVVNLSLALHYAHSQNVVHRDVKPENIILDADGKPCITDFGLAHLEEGDELQTREGMRIGTPAYMSPEQHAGQSHSVDARSDLWSLGVIFYELLTQRRPFQSSDHVELAKVVREKEPVSPRKIDRSIPKDLETICLKCLGKTPESRYRSCQDLADELGRWLRDEPIRARPISPVERGWRWCRRNPVVATLTMLFVVALLTGTGVSTYFAIEANRQARTATVNAEQAASNEQQARKAQETANRRLYASQINVAQQALDRGHIDQALELLYAQLPEPGEEDLRGFEWYFLWRMAHGEEAALRGHTDIVTRVAFCPIEGYLATGSADGTVRLWDPDTGRPFVIVAQGLPFTDLAFSSHGQWLAVATRNNILLWSLYKGKTTATFKRDPAWGWIDSVAFSPDRSTIASGNVDGTITLWDVATRERLRTFEAHADEVRSLAFSPNGRLIATGSKDRTIKVWEWATGRELKTLTEHGGVVQSVAFSPDGKLLGSGSWDRTVKLWDTDSWESIATFTSHGGIIRQVAFSPDGKSLASASEDKTVRIWDVVALRERAILPGHPNMVRGVAFSPDGRTVAAVSHDDRAGEGEESLTGAQGVIKLWDTGTWQERQLAKMQADPAIVEWNTPVSVRQVGLSADGTMLATAHLDHTVRLWNVETNEEMALFEGHSSWILAVAFSPDGRILATAGDDGTVKLWNLSTHDEIASLDVSAEQTRCVRFSPDSTWLASAGSASVKVWNLTAATEPLESKTLRGEFWHVAFSPDGAFVAGSDGDKGHVSLWDHVSERELGVLRPRSNQEVGPIKAMAFSPEGDTLITVAADGTIVRWDLASNESLPAIHAGIEHTSPVAMSADGTRMATIGQMRTLILWDVVTGQRLLTIRGYDHGITSVAFAEDSQSLAVGMSTWEERGPVMVLKVATAEEVYADCLHDAEQNWGDFSRQRALVLCCWNLANDLQPNTPHTGETALAYLEQGLTTLRNLEAESRLNEREQGWIAVFQDAIAVLPPGDPQDALGSSEISK